jgi:hypothetical protein
MSTAAAIVGLAAAVCTVIGAMIISVRWLGKKLDAWIETNVENSRAVRGLTERITRLEGTLKR